MRNRLGWRWLRNLAMVVGAAWLILKSIVWSKPLDPDIAAWLNGLFGVIR